MAITGKVKTLFSNKEKTEAMFPRTKTTAISDDNGTGLNVLLDNIHKEIDGLTYSDVGAAPAGYGLGESVHYSETVHRMKSVEEMDEVYVCGWSFFYPEKPVILNGISVSYGVLFTTGLNNERACQELYVNNIRFKLVRWRASSGWKEWACEAPPMAAGVEYLTTEWWNGKAVYTKCIDCGTLPNASQKAIQHGISATKIIRFAGTTNEGYSLPYFSGSNYYVDIAVTTSTIYLTSSADYSSAVGYIQLWYTKD